MEIISSPQKRGNGKALDIYFDFKNHYKKIE